MLKIVNKLFESFKLLLEVKQIPLENNIVEVANYNASVTTI